jgi:hypothetical protein
MTAFKWAKSEKVTEMGRYSIVQKIGFEYIFKNMTSKRVSYRLGGCKR